MISNHLFNGGISQNKELWVMLQRYVEDSSTGPVFFVNAEGEVVEVPMETAIFFDRKFWNVPSFHNYLSAPLSPATQTTDTLGVGNYTLWMRGTGSAAVSAGTATITGAGTANDGNPLHFSVTVAGTVNVTVSGDCTVFQLTDTVFSTEPFLSTSSTTVVSRAGTTSIPCVRGGNGNKLFELFSGKADGDELISNGDFSDGSTGWILDAGFAVSDGVLVGTGVSSLRYIKQVISGLTLGYRYELAIDITENTFNGYGFFESTQSCLSSAMVYINTVGLNYLRGVADSDVTNTLKLGISSTNTSGHIKISDISVKHISSPQAKFVFKITPMFASSDLPASHEESILNTGTIDMLTLGTDASGNGYINCSDGTNTATVAYDWESGEELIIEAPIGYNVAEAANKMQLKVNGEVSALTAFDGSFGPDTEMTMGQNNDYLFGLDMSVYPLKQRDFE